jgi:hypothetical protein
MFILNEADIYSATVLSRGNIPAVFVLPKIKFNITPTTTKTIPNSDKTEKVSPKKMKPKVSA